MDFDSYLRTCTSVQVYVFLSFRDGLCRWTPANVHGRGGGCGCHSIIESVDSISRDERDVPLTQYITNA